MKRTTYVVEWPIENSSTDVAGDVASTDATQSGRKRTPSLLSHSVSPFRCPRLASSIIQRRSKVRSAGDWPPSRDLFWFLLVSCWETIGGVLQSSCPPPSELLAFVFPRRDTIERSMALFIIFFFTFRIATFLDGAGDASGGFDYLLPCIGRRAGDRTPNAAEFPNWWVTTPRCRGFRGRGGSRPQNKTGVLGSSVGELDCWIFSAFQGVATPSGVTTHPLAIKFPNWWTSRPPKQKEVSSVVVGRDPTGS